MNRLQPVVPARSRPSHGPRAVRALRWTLLGFVIPCLAFALHGANTAPPLAAQNLPSTDSFVDVDVYGSTIIMQTLPAEIVLAELLGADGTQKATGQGFADGAGSANVQFFAFGGPDVDPVMRPGDQVRLASLGAAVREITIPPFSAAVDVGADRIAGAGTAGSEIAIALHLADGSRLERSVVVDGQGAWILDLAGEVDLPPGGVTGTARMTEGDVRFTLPFGVFRAELVLGAAEITGGAGGGDTVYAAVSGPGGPTLQAPPTEVVGGPAWALSLGARQGGFGPGPGPGQGPGQGPRHLAAGDTVTLTHRAAGATQVHSTTLPALSLTLDSSSDSLQGTALPGAMLRIEAESLDGGSAQADAVADENGAFQVDLSDQADLGPGWRARAWLDISPELRVGAVAVVPLVRFGVSMQTIHGLADPGHSITVTLRSSDGGTEGEQVSTPSADGRFAVALGSFFLGPSEPGPDAEINEGDRIEVAVVAGDPWVATVPRLTAVADPEGDVVTGEAPPGSTIRLIGPPNGDETATVGPDGTYRVPWPGLVAPASGQVAIRLNGPFEAYTNVSATSLSVQLGGGFVFGNGPPGRRVSGAIVAPDGREIARASDRVIDMTSLNAVIIRVGGVGGLDAFGLDFRDLADMPVPIAPGDRIRVTVGDDEIEMTVPPLDGVAFLADDAVVGHTAPNGIVRLALRPSAGGLGVRGEATADDTGAYTYDFGEQADLAHNDSIQLATFTGAPDSQHTVTRYAAVPGLTIDLDTSVLTGTVAPNARLPITVRRSGGILARTSSVADESGLFSVALRDGTGAPFPFREGDQIEVAPEEQNLPTQTLTVPRLTIDPDPTANRVDGSASPGGSLIVLATNGVRRDLGEGLAQAWPEIGADGRWVADFVPRFPIEPGRAYTAQYRLPEGHAATRTRYVPLLGVEHGGSTACGVTAPNTPVSARQLDGGAEVAAGAGRSGAGSRYGIRLTTPDGAPARMGDGARVEADLAGTAAALTLPELSVDVDWESGQISGSGPPNLFYRWLYPARRCLDTGDPFVDFTAVLGGFSGEQGRIGGFLLPYVTPGEGMTLELSDENGHRIFRDVWRALAEIHVGDDRVTGVADGGAPVTATLRAADGTAKATAADVADPLSGAYLLRFADPGDADTPVTITPGDTVELHAGDGAATDPWSSAQRATIRVEALSFDWAAGRPIDGVAPPNRGVTLRLRLGDGRTLNVTRESNDAGRFTLGPNDVPPRADWLWSDIVAIQARLETPRGHVLVAQTEGFAPGQRPDDGRTIFLPYGVASGGQSNALDAGHALPADTLRARPADVVRAGWEAPASAAQRGQLPGFHHARRALQTILWSAAIQDHVRE